MALFRCGGGQISDILAEIIDPGKAIYFSSSMSIVTVSPTYNGSSGNQHCFIVNTTGYTTIAGAGGVNNYMFGLDRDTGSLVAITGGNVSNYDFVLVQEMSTATFPAYLALT